MEASSRTGRWLRERRLRFVLWIAGIEALIVALFHDATKWTVVGLAIVAVAAWAAWGRSAGSDSVRQVTWIAAASQLLAVVAVILAILVFWTAIVLAVVFACVALFFVFSDRR